MAKQEPKFKPGDVVEYCPQWEGNKTYKGSIGIIISCDSDDLYQVGWVVHNFKFEANKVGWSEEPLRLFNRHK